MANVVESVSVLSDRLVVVSSPGQRWRSASEILLSSEPGETSTRKLVSSPAGIANSSAGVFHLRGSRAKHEDLHGVHLPRPLIPGAAVAEPEYLRDGRGRVQLTVRV